jgi:hypothetical protein
MVVPVRAARKSFEPPGALAQWRIMGDLDLLTAADVQLMQGLAQRVTAVRPDRVNGASRGARAV